MPFLESIFEGLIGEIFGEIIWRKIIKPFFYHFGAVFQIFLNLFRKNKVDPYKMDNNAVVGFVVFGFLTFVIILIIFH